MDLMNNYLLEHLVDARLADLRADAARMQRVALRAVDAPRPARSFGAWVVDCARSFVNAPRSRAPLSPPSRAGGA